MLQLIPALIKIIVFALFSINFGFAQKAVSCGNQPLDFLQKKIYEPDSAKEYIMALYCIRFDSEYREHGKNGIWRLARTEQFMPMPSIKIDVECSKSYSLFTGVSSISEEIAGGTGYLKEIKSCAANYDCRYSVNEEYKIDEDFESIFAGVIDSVQAISLVGKTFSFKWNMGFTCSGKKLYDLSGIFNIKISGICNEEQLKKIEALNKARKEK